MYSNADALIPSHLNSCDMQGQQVGWQAYSDWTRLLTCSQCSVHFN